MTDRTVGDMTVLLQINRQIGVCDVAQVPDGHGRHAAAWIVPP